MLILKKTLLFMEEKKCCVKIILEKYKLSKNSFNVKETYYMYLLQFLKLLSMFLK